MTLHLTPEILEGAYELLRMTPPFKRWKLPHADDLEFTVLVTTERCGHFREAQNGIHEIGVSNSRVHTLDELFQVLAHEMAHLRQCQLGHRDTHGKNFKELADRICTAHSFNPKTF